MKYKDIELQLDIDYQDAGPWRSYTLVSEGNDINELIDNGTIIEIDQDGGDIGDYYLKDSSGEVFNRAIEELKILTGYRAPFKMLNEYTYNFAYTDEDGHNYHKNNVDVIKAMDADYVIEKALKDNQQYNITNLNVFKLGEFGETVNKYTWKKGKN